MRGGSCVGGERIHTPARSQGVERFVVVLGGGGGVMLAIISKSDHEPRTNGELEDLGG